MGEFVADREISRLGRVEDSGVLVAAWEFEATRLEIGIEGSRGDAIVDMMDGEGRATRNRRLRLPLFFKLGT